MLGLWTKKSMNTGDKRKVRSFESAYTFNAQYDGAAMFFVIVKMLQPDTCAGFSDIKSNMEE